MLGWEAVGRLDMPHGFCTGALIGRDLVLTAAHCVYDTATRQPYPARGMTFRAGYHHGSAITERRVERWAVPERYAAELPTAARAHSGWVQADVAEDFFPACMVSDEAMALLAPLRTSDDLPAPVRRRVTDAVDELERRRAVIARFGRA